MPNNEVKRNTNYDLLRKEYLLEYKNYYEEYVGNELLKKIKSLNKKYFSILAFSPLEIILMKAISTSSLHAYNDFGFFFFFYFFERIIDDNVYFNNDKGLKRRVYKIDERQVLDKLAFAYRLSKDQTEKRILAQYFAELLAEKISFLKEKNVEYSPFFDLTIQNFNTELNEKLELLIPQTFNFKGKVTRIFYSYYALNNLQDKASEYVPRLVSDTFNPIEESANTGKSKLKLELRKYVRKIIPDSRETIRPLKERFKRNCTPLQYELYKLLVEHNEIMNAYSNSFSKVGYISEKKKEIESTEKEPDTLMLEDLMLAKEKVLNKKLLTENEKTLYIYFIYEEVNRNLEKLNKMLIKENVINEPINRPFIDGLLVKLKNIYRG